MDSSRSSSIVENMAFSSVKLFACRFALRFAAANQVGAVAVPQDVRNKLKERRKAFELL
ncbi:MAG: hypothetical protein LBJ61_03570 [Deltaproteobacteria bacterium]|nr:hypothetical protein [Deltaproteobacteria bacterium]